MINRSLVERILSANGVEPTSPDEEIKSILIKAKWHADDVDTALTVLRENTVTHKQHVDSIHKVFRTDERLRPETITSLLGIDMEVPVPSSVTKKQTKKLSRTIQILNIAVISLTIAICMALTSMWIWKIGIFHHTY